MHFCTCFLELIFLSINAQQVAIFFDRSKNKYSIEILLEMYSLLWTHFIASAENVNLKGFCFQKYKTETIFRQKVVRLTIPSEWWNDFVSKVFFIG